MAYTIYFIVGILKIRNILVNTVDTVDILSLVGRFHNLYIHGIIGYSFNGSLSYVCLQIINQCTHSTEICVSKGSLLLDNIQAQYPVDRLDATGRDIPDCKQ